MTKLQQLAWTSAHPRKESPLPYDGLDPLLNLTIRLLKENMAMKEMYTPKQDYIMMPIANFDANDIEIEKMGDSGEV